MRLEENRFWSQFALVRVLAQLLTNGTTLGKLLKLCVTQFSNL